MTYRDGPEILDTFSFDRAKAFALRLRDRCCDRATIAPHRLGHGWLGDEAGITAPQIHRWACAPRREAGGISSDELGSATVRRRDRAAWLRRANAPYCVYVGASLGPKLNWRLRSDPGAQGFRAA